MTRKIVTVYYSMSPVKRWAITLAMLAVVILGSVMAATAAGGITFSGQSPANGSVVAAAKPVIGVSINASEGAVAESDLQMFVDSQQVTPSLASGSSPGTYSVSYTPDTALSNGSHTVAVSVYDSTYSAAATANWSFSVDAAPVVTGIAPADGAAVDSRSPLITVKVKDTFDNLNAGSVSLKVDGAAVPASFVFKGYENYDTCTGDYLGYVITSYKEGTLTYQTADLHDGVHNVELSMADDKGNVLTKQWSLKIATKPLFSAFTPANGAAARSFSGISVKVADADNNINPDSIVLKINNIQVAHSYDASVGTIVYNNDFGYGTHAVTVSATDTQGNVGTASWSFIVDTRAPEIKVDPVSVWTGTYFKPVPFGSATITDGKLSFRATLNDLVDISGLADVPDAVLKLDGQPLPADVSYELIYDTCTGDPLGIKSRKKAFVTYGGIISDGPHTLTLTRGDILGYAGTETWNLLVETKPVITQWKPVTYISEFKPVISANIKDGNNTIDRAAITMTLDGQTVTPGYDPGTGNLTYTPVQALSNEAYHTVTLSAYDAGGLASSISWKFYINTYPDMADANISNCTACHTYTDSQYANGAFESIHARKLNFGGSHSRNNCVPCHNYITQPDTCGQCHAFDTEIADGSGPHGTTPSIQYGLKKGDPYTPIRITQNREMWDCVICHQPGSGIMKRQSPTVNIWIPQNNHDLPELHKAPASSCNQCHALSLTREHARSGRADANGQPINCNTCHKSTVSAVVYAIANNNKNCSACHNQADHESMHISSLDASCLTCHKAALTVEHMSNYTTAGKSYTCDTCHGNSGKEAKRAIAVNNLSCAGCHKQGHNINLADNVPANIPLYTGFVWTTPLEASLFVGEAGDPSGYVDGQLIISNRRSDVTSDQLWNFYSSQLTAKGWVVKSGAPAAGAAGFTAEFISGERAATVKVYNTENRDGTGQPNAAGYRIELWYK